jgi:peptide/nickel transport system substrate-binding protein
MRALRARGALLSVVVAGLVLAGVAAASQTRTTAKPPTYKNGGTLTIGLADEPDALDPTLARTFSGRMVFLAMCQKLYDIDAHLNIVPQLAAALPTFSTNKRTMTIKLRHGITFNDGTPFNAAAVKMSLDRHKTLPRSVRASELAPVTSVDTQGNYTVVLHLANRYAPITAQLADRAGMIMSPKALNDLGANFASNPVCVGPFMFKERVAGDHITLVRSPYYYARSKVHFDSLEYRIIADPSARAVNLRAHAIGFAPISSTDLQSVLHDSSLRLLRAVSLGYQGITINIGNKSGVGKPYENVGTPLARSADLRRAFALALDRNLLNRVAYGGTQQPDCFPWPPQNPYSAATKGIPCNLTANVAAAKAAFERSGATAPVDVHIMLGTDTVSERFGALIQEMEKQVGFNVILEPTEFATALARAGAGDFETFVTGPGGFVDPDHNVYEIVNSKGSFDLGGYANATVDRATNRARSIVDPAKRIAWYHVALVQLAKDVPVIYLFHGINFYGVSANVVGVHVYGDGLIRPQFAGFRK